MGKGAGEGPDPVAPQRGPARRRWVEARGLPRPGPAVRGGWRWGGEGGLSPLSPSPPLIPSIPAPPSQHPSPRLPFGPFPLPPCPFYYPFIPPAPHAVPAFTWEPNARAVPQRFPPSCCFLLSSSLAIYLFINIFFSCEKQRRERWGGWLQVAEPSRCWLLLPCAHPERAQLQCIR